MKEVFLSFYLILFYHYGYPHNAGGPMLLNKYKSIDSCLLAAKEAENYQSNSDVRARLIYLCIPVVLNDSH